MVLVLAELKSKTVHAGEVVEKLKNSAITALEMINNAGFSMANRDVFLLLLSKGIKSTELKTLKNRKVIINGKKHMILPQRCGIRVAEVFHKVGN